MCSEALATPEKVVVGTRPGRYPVNWPLLARVGMPQGRAPGGGNTVARGSREATSPWVFLRNPPRWPPLLGLDYVHSEGPRSRPVLTERRSGKTKSVALDEENSILLL